MVDKKILLQIVRTWKISKKPEYRGFRCANCQKYICKAWQYLLKEGGYKTPVHFCKNCQTNFNFKFKGIYKIFTCDNCSKKIHKAYHVWTKKDGILSEAHFCKKCGNSLEFGEKIKGIIYDLDGTIISTLRLHKSAWLKNGKKFNVPITKEMLRIQRGISNELAAGMMLPNNRKYLFKDFIKTKKEYVLKNLKQVSLFPGAVKVISRLRQKGYKVWICTAAPRDYVKKILDNFKELKKAIKNNIVWREMYKRERPSPDMINLIIKETGVRKDQILYIGDAISDYKLTKKNNIKFIYFCPNFKERDLRIPKSVPAISSQEEIFKILNS